MGRYPALLPSLSMIFAVGFTLAPFWNSSHEYNPTPSPAEVARAQRLSELAAYDRPLVPEFTAMDIAAIFPPGRALRIGLEGAGGISRVGAESYEIIDGVRRAKAAAEREAAKSGAVVTFDA